MATSPPTTSMDGRLRCFKRTLKAVLWYKKYGKHLPGTTRAERRVVKYKAKIYQVNNGVLYVLRRTKRCNGFKEVLFDAQRIMHVLEDCHLGPAGEHYGIDRTLGHAQLKYFWRGMRLDVQEYIQNCPTCVKKSQEVKPHLDPSIVVRILEMPIDPDAEVVIAE